MSTDPLVVVRRNLRTYSDRGVFRGLKEITPRNGKQSFTFVWLGSRPLEFNIDKNAGLLTFKQLLPNVPAKSPLYAEVKLFLKSRHDRDLPKHRRIDPGRAQVVWENRAGNVSIGLRIRNNHYGYGSKRLVNLVHEIYVFLNDSHPDYMCENFDIPQE